jgi:3-dehydroquinate synthase
MNPITVKAEIDYEITFPESWVEQVESAIESRRVLIITTDFLFEHFKIGEKFPSASYFILPDGEDAKSIFQLERGLEAAGEFGLDRGSLIIAIGGGSVTDFAGFLASIWLRGIAWIAIPTTLAGMVDAAIGGKTGINSRFGKNLIGSFYSPINTVIDLNFLTSLSDRDFSAGLAEVIKAGFIGDREILNILESFTIEGFKLDPKGEKKDLLLQLIWRSAKIKAEIVSQDFKENGVREFLNYGHTLGHAIEKHSNYSLRHGEAVSIGLVFAAALAVEIGKLEQHVAVQHSQLLEKFGLPVKYPDIDFEEVLPFLLRDKKIKGPLLRFVLLGDIQDPFIAENISLEQLRSLYHRIIR